MTLSAYIHTLFGNEFVQIALTIIATLIVQDIIRRFLIVAIRKSVSKHKYSNAQEKRQREDTLIRIFNTLSRIILWIIAFVVILGELHVNIAALLTGAGLVGIVFGIGAQNIIKDYLAGILIILEDQYRVGDIVQLSAGVSGGIAGVVEDVSIRATRLRDIDGKLHIVPNGSSGVITNMSSKFAQVNVDVGIAYESDIDKVEKLINDIGLAISKDKAWADKVIEPIKFIRIDTFGDSSITIKSVGKVKPATQWDVSGEFRRRLKIAFEKNGISIPFPQIVMHQAKNQ